MAVIALRIVAGHNAAEALTQIKLAASRFPGEHELTLLISTPDDLLSGRVTRRLALGPAWRYDASPACLAALREFGTPEVLQDDDIRPRASGAARGGPSQRAHRRPHG